MLRTTLGRGLTAAIVLSLALVGTTLAATSQQMTQTLTVNSSLSITGVPATLDFGSANAGTTASAASSVTPAVTTSNATGANLYLAINDLQDINLNAIPATDEIIATQVGSGTPTLVAPYDSANGSPYQSATNAPEQLAYQGTSGTWSVLVDLSIAIPANTTPGAYSGVATFSVVDRP